MWLRLFSICVFLSDSLSVTPSSSIYVTVNSKISSLFLAKEDSIVHISKCLYLLHWYWVCGLFPELTNCKWCCYKQRCTYVLLNEWFCLLGVDAPKQNLRVIWISIWLLEKTPNHFPKKLTKAAENEVVLFIASPVALVVSGLFNIDHFCW